MSREPEPSDWETTSTAIAVTNPPDGVTSPVTPVVEVTPTTEAQAETVASEASSEPEDREPETGRFKRRHRARSQQAGPEDVPRIKELTRKHKEAEASWQKELTDLRKQLDERTAPKPIEPPKPFEGIEPKLDDFANDPDPYGSYLRAATRYDRQKEQAELEATRAKETTQQQEAQRFQSLQARHSDRVTAFKASHADWDEKLGSVAQYVIPDVLKVAILEDDKSADVVYALASKPDILAELILSSDGRAVTETNVALLRRLLASRVPVAPTRSTAAPVVPTRPIPPNLVRTGVGKVEPSEAPPDDASFEDHERAFPMRRLRRR